MNIDFDTLAASIFGRSAAFPVSNTRLLNVDDTDLSRFKRHGGKLIIWQPQSGGPFSPQDMVNWYTDMSREMRGFDETQEFARLFMMPGVNHCGGGPGTSAIDAFSPVVDWVENGTRAGQHPRHCAGRDAVAWPHAATVSLSPVRALQGHRRHQRGEQLRMPRRQAPPPSSPRPRRR